MALSKSEVVGLPQVRVNVPLVDNDDTSLGKLSLGIDGVWASLGRSCHLPLEGKRKCSSIGKSLQMYNRAESLLMHVFSVDFLY